MIIDSHTHWGRSAWGDFSPEYLMNIIDNSIDFAICSNLEGIESPNFKFEKVKGHSAGITENEKWNNYVDKLAVRAREG